MSIQAFPGWTLAEGASLNNTCLKKHPFIYRNRFKTFLCPPLVLVFSGALAAPASAVPKGFTLDETTTRIVVSNQRRELGERIAAGVRERTGLSIPILSDQAVDEQAWTTFNLVLIGNLNDNQAVARLYFDYEVFLDASFPGEGGFMVKTLVEPLGLGKNAVLVGGSDLRGHRKAVEQLLRLIRKYGRELPALHAFSSRFMPEPASSARKIAELREENRHNFDVGLGSKSLWNVTRYGFNYHFTAEPGWAQAFKEVLLDYIRLGRQHRGNWDFDPMNSLYFRLAGLISVWDLIEYSPEFTEQERSTITTAFLEMARYVSTLSYATYLANPPGEPRQNHSTFLDLSLEAAARYFSKSGYEVDIATWRSITERIFGGQIRTYRADDDAAGYTMMAPLHTFDYYQRQGSERALRTGFLDKLADLSIILTDNRREDVSFGDVRTYFPIDEKIDKIGTSGTELAWRWKAAALSRSVWTHGDPGHQWLFDWLVQERATELSAPYSQNYLNMQLYAMDAQAHRPGRFFGIRSILMDKPALQWIASRTIRPEWLPRRGQRYLDKLSLRKRFDPQEEYLLIDGIAAFAHGHKDANAILRLTWLDRIWLANLDYTRRQPRHNNSVDVIRDGQTDILPPLSVLAVNSDQGDTAFVRVDLSAYNGTDWRRNLIWKKGRYFVIIDELKARAADNYDLRCYWRVLGDVSQREDVLEVSQPGGYFRIAAAAPYRYSLSEVDLEKIPRNQIGNWSSYPYSDGIVRILSQQQQHKLPDGKSAYFINLLYARPDREESDLRITSLLEGVARVTGESHDQLVGVAPSFRQIGPVRIQANVFELSPRHVRAAGLSRLHAEHGSLRSSLPVDLTLRANGEGELRTTSGTTVDLSGGWVLVDETSVMRTGVRSRSLQPGTHPIRFDGRFFSPEEWVFLGNPTRALESAKAAPLVEFGLTKKHSSEAGSEAIVLKELRLKDQEGWLLGLRDGRVQRLAKTGELTQLQYLGSEVRALEYDSQRLIVGDREGRITAYSWAGNKLWEQGFDSFWGYRERIVELSFSSDGDRKHLLVATESPRAHALDLEGNRLWSTPAEGTLEADTEDRWVEWWGALTRLVPADLDSDGRQEIVIGTEYKPPLVILESDGRLRLLTWGWGGGESRSKTPYLGINARDLRVAQLGPAGNPSIIYGTETDEIYVLDRDGRLQWSTNVGGEVNAIAVEDLGRDGGKEIIATTGTGHLVVLTAEGQRLWWRRHPSGLNTLSVQRVNRSAGVFLAAGSEEGSLFVYDSIGNLIGTASTGSPVRHVRLLDHEEGEVLSVGSGGEIHIWSLAVQRKFSRSRRHHY